MSALHLLAPERPRQQVLRWPRDVPTDARAKLGDGLRGFHMCHEGNPRSLLHHQKIRVKNHLLIVVDMGALRIERNGRWQDVRSNEAVLLSDTEFILSEITESGSNYGAFVLFFFDDDLLGRVPSPGYEAFTVLHRFGSHPCDEHLTVIPRTTIAAVLSRHVPRFSQILIQLLRITYNGLVPSLLKLVASRIIIPRLKIQLFAESMVFLPPGSFAARMQSYPDGAATLRREIRRMGMGGIKKVVARCRREWRPLWQKMRLDRKNTWSALHPQRSSATRRVPQSKIQQTTEPMQNLAVTPNLPTIETPTQPEGGNSSDFVENLKELQLATLEELLAPTNIIELPGLENWQNLLKAA